MYISSYERVESLRSELREALEAVADWKSSYEAAVETGQETEVEVRDMREALTRNTTELIKIDADIANRRYLPSLEKCRTIHDARRVVDQYDGYRMTLVERIKRVADDLRAVSRKEDKAQ